MSGDFDRAEERRERRSYLVGYALALVLTVPLFFAVGLHWLDRQVVLWIAGIAAVVQMAVHFRFFLHIRLHGQTREDLHLILFTALVLILMAGGTIWILFDLSARM